MRGLARYGCYLAATACTMAWAPIAAAQDKAWDDATIIHAGGGTFLLDRAVDMALSDSSAMRAGMKRIGLKRACAIASAAREQAVTAQEGAFLPALVAAMCMQIPAEYLTGPAFPAFVGGPLIRFKTRVSDELERDAASTYARAKAAALADFERGSAAAPPALGDWADIYGDWDLTTANAVSVACMLYDMTDPASGKRAFDMFYQREENR